MWLHSLKVAQLLRSAACLHTNQSRTYLNHLVAREVIRAWISLRILQFFFVVCDATSVGGKFNIGNFCFVFGRSFARISVGLPAVFQRLRVLRQSPRADFFKVPSDRLLYLHTINFYVYLPLLLFELFLFGIFATLLRKPC